MNLCITCKIRFKTVQELHEHEKSHIPKLDVLPYACSRCDKAFAKVSDITVHIRASHKQTSTEELVQTYGAKPVVGNSKLHLKNAAQHIGNIKQHPTKKVKLKK